MRARSQIVLKHVSANRRRLIYLYLQTGASDSLVRGRNIERSPGVIATDVPEKLDAISTGKRIYLSRNSIFLRLSSFTMSAIFSTLLLPL